ncbi:hypothetical protein EI94DRAFT_1732897 [Lactarius quietus]|nr:hypothetical protein EI94DRAFT_1732897 [Lactarius quietus]
MHQRILGLSYMRLKWLTRSLWRGVFMRLRGILNVKSEFEWRLQLYVPKKVVGYGSRQHDIHLGNSEESLRLHPVVPVIPREATRDDVIPLASPIVTKSGEQVSSIQVRKGTPVDIAVCVYRRLPEIWGSDADEFNPDRFLNTDKSKRSSIGVFANL